MYNEYRILKAKYHLIFFDSNVLTNNTATGLVLPTTQLIGNTGYTGSGHLSHAMMSYGWLRSAKYGVDPAFADTTAL